MEIEQGTPEWHELRRGKVTASCIHFVTAKGKNGQMAATRRKYMARLVAERWSGKCAPEGYVSDAMKQGTEREPQARAAYEFMSDCQIKKVPFVDHADIVMCGCSPDGLVGDTGLVEIKCPEIQTHLDYLMQDEVPTDYVPQMQFQMACTGRHWVDFVSFNPDVPPRGQVFIKRLSRDTSIIRTQETEVAAFALEMDFRLSVLQERFK